MQSLLGKLSFVTACVKSGRTFTSRLLNNLHTFPSSQHTTAVSQDMRLDLDWWLTFLPLFNGVSSIKSEVWSFSDFNFATDACFNRGGATCQDQCCSVVFPPNIVQEAAHITALELFVVVVTIRAWAPLLAHHYFIVSCENEAGITVIKSGFTHDPYMQHCLRKLWFTASLHNFEICAFIVPGDHNFLPDTLSRWHLHLQHRHDFNFYCRELALSTLLLTCLNNSYVFRYRSWPFFCSLDVNYYFSVILGPYPRIVVIDQLKDHITSLAFAESTQKNMQSHLNAYLSFALPVIAIFTHFLWTLLWFHITLFILLMSVATLAPSKITFQS